MFFMFLFLRNMYMILTVHYPNHVIDWDAIQVDLEGEFQTDPLCILDREVTMLQNRVVG